MKITEHKFPLLTVLILITIALVVATSVLNHFSPPEPYASTIKSYEGVVVYVDSEKIFFDNNMVLFIHNIKEFDWVLNKSYNITVEKYWYSIDYYIVEKWCTTNYIKEVKVLK